jgi:Kef-type K+ transport system membrane component KefB
MKQRRPTRRVDSLLRVSEDELTSFLSSLSACKGLVELIVLNIGLNAGILNPQVFAMFVCMALYVFFLLFSLAQLIFPRVLFYAASPPS